MATGIVRVMRQTLQIGCMMAADIPIVSSHVPYAFEVNFLGDV